MPPLVDADAAVGSRWHAPACDDKSMEPLRGHGHADPSSRGWFVLRQCRMIAMRVDTPMKELLFTTVHIRVETSNGVVEGTGFIYNAARGDASTPVLITNKHVIAGATKGIIRLIGRTGDEPDLGNPIEVAYDDFLALWQGHPSSDVDVAAMFLGPTVNQATSAGRPPFFKMAAPGLCPSDAVVRQLDVVETVTFIGYPSGLYDHVNHTPIVRQGTTATPIELNWNGSPAFLIDGSVFPGSSGSPVFLLQQGIVRSGTSLSIGGAPRLFLLGIIAAVYLQKETGQIVVAAQTPQVQFNQMIDLGLVYKWTAIEETVDALCAANGVDRGTVSELQPPQAPQPPAEVTGGP